MKTTMVLIELCALLCALATFTYAAAPPKKLTLQQRSFLTCIGPYEATTHCRLIVAELYLKPGECAYYLCTKEVYCHKLGSEKFTWMYPEKVVPFVMACPPLWAEREEQAVRETLAPCFNPIHGSGSTLVIRSRAVDTVCRAVGTYSVPCLRRSWNVTSIVPCSGVIVDYRMADLLHSATPSPISYNWECGIYAHGEQCLDVSGGDLQAMPCNGALAQTICIDVASGYVKAKDSNLMLEVTQDGVELFEWFETESSLILSNTWLVGTENGALLLASSCLAADPQTRQFILVPADATVCSHWEFIQNKK